MIFHRILNLDIPSGQSAFLWGARQTGKSTFLKAHFKESFYIDLLDSELYLTYSKSPHLFRHHVKSLSEKLKQKHIIVDEIQRIPILLNEVHKLIEDEKLAFILCGSSARKLKKEGVNLLGGRAWRFNFYPLTYHEIESFDLLTALSQGLLPRHYQSGHIQRDLKAYIANYLKDEIQVEALVRNLPAFAKFLDVVGFTHGGMVNYSNIASEVGVNLNVVKEYYQILVDTLLGYQIFPFRKQAKRQIINSMPKFYLFDVGIANHLAQKTISSLSGQDAGNAFEHFLLMEIIAYRGLKEKEFEINYWRTKTGIEVDFILNNGKVAVEVKSSNQVRESMTKNLKAFMEEHRPEHSLIVSQDFAKRVIETEFGLIEVLPWQEFLEDLWSGRFV